MGFDVGAPPVVFFVEVVAERVVGLFPPRRRDIQALSRPKLDAGGDDVDMVAVIDGQIVILICFKPGERQLLELFQHFFFLLGGRAVFWRESDDGGAVAVAERERIPKLGHLLGVAAKN